MVGSGRVNAVLVGDDLPELGADLVTALASLDVDDLTAGETEMSEARPRNRPCDAGGLLCDLPHLVVLVVVRGVGLKSTCVGVEPGGLIRVRTLRATQVQAAAHALPPRLTGVHLPLTGIDGIHPSALYCLFVLKGPLQEQILDLYKQTHEGNPGSHS